MRRLIATAVALGFAALPAGAPAATPQRLEISRPAAPAPAFAHVTGVGANLVVRGRAPRGSRVALSAPCTRTPCTAVATADRKGRWSAVLELVLPGGTLGVRVTAVAGAARRTAHVALVPPLIREVRSAPRLTVIGDSLAEGTAKLLPGLLPGWNVTTHARTGRFLAQGLAILEQTALPDPPPILAFSLFTNDDPRHLDALEAAVRQALARVGPSGCVIWATIRRPALAGVSYGAANTRLQRLAEERTGPRLVLVPWAETVARAPKLLSRDRVHPTPAGYARRAALFAQAAQACAAPQPAPVPAPDGGAVAPG